MIQKKRFFLPIFFGLGVLVFEETRDFIYMPFIVTPCFFVLFWNFPKIVYYTNSKPLFYEDLFIDEKKIPNYEISISLKQKFNKIFEWSLIITTSLLTGALSDYWLYKTANLNSPIELAGVTGGIITLFRNINDIIGKIIMKFLRKQIKKETHQPTSQEVNLETKQKINSKNEWNKIITPEHLRSLTPPPLNHQIEIIQTRIRADTI